MVDMTNINLEITKDITFNVSQHLVYPTFFNEVQGAWLAAGLWLRKALLANDSHPLKTQVSECFTVKWIQVKGAQLIIDLCSTR